MSPQDSQETKDQPFLQDLELRDAAVPTIMEGLRAKFKRQKKRHLRSDEEYRELALKQLASSIANGPDNHLGTAAPQQ